MYQKKKKKLLISQLSSSYSKIIDNNELRILYFYKKIIKGKLKVYQKMGSCDAAQSEIVKI